MKKIFYSFLLLIIVACSETQPDPLSNVNPFIGTDGHGHTYPGAAMPFGMVQLSPDTRKDNWDACSGYHYSDAAVLGFSHTHLSGTGVGDYGDVRFMPMTGTLRIRPGNENEDGYRSGFSHDREEATPGYYRVFLDDPGINAEFTVTERCGFHKYTFPESEESYILIDLKESVVTETNLGLDIEIINDHEICGKRKSSGWAENQVVYFYAVFSRPFDESGTVSDGLVSMGVPAASGSDVQAYASYATTKNESILVKVGISGVSTEGARKNLEAEIPDWDFDKVRLNAEAAWREKLNKIEVRGGDHDSYTKFYTALYHCYLAPNLFSDIDGHYRAHDGSIQHAADFFMYTVFSLWDTYRALHPLMTILEPGPTADFIESFLDIHDKGGLLPVWELAGNETNCMIGYHAVPVIFDAYIKGISGYDPERAYTAIKKSAMQDQFGLKWYREYGYIPAETEGEAVSKTLEYAYDDWCIAMMAKKLGKEDDYRYFIERAQYYKNIFDPDTRFLRGKRNGMFAEPFDPAEVNFMLTEANTWQYTFYVPQDISGLIDLMGGEKMFEEKLDEMFSATTKLSGRQQADITGLIGQYAHGNEPSQHMAYLYNYIGQPAKTQKLARQIMDELYGADPAGLCGNEDCGQMSAWMVLSAMGFYPVTPGAGEYAIGSPLFDEVIIHLDNGQKFIVTAKNNSASNIYIQTASLNDQPYDRSFLSHDQIMNGGLLNFNMGLADKSGWGEALTSRPVTKITEYLITPVPYFQAASSSFQENLVIQLRTIDKMVEIVYQLPSDDRSEDFQLYKEPMLTDKNISIKAKAIKNDSIESKEAVASFYKIHHNWKVNVKYPCSPQYTGGGDLALIDGQNGGPNFRTGSWQGYHGVDFEATVDMGENQDIGKISASFLQDQRSWIFMPVEVEFSVSDDNMAFRPLAAVKNEVADTIPEALIKEFTTEKISASGRYLKVKALNRGICPAWHVGAGNKSWIFVDEIIIE